MNKDAVRFGRITGMYGLLGMGKEWDGLSGTKYVYSEQ